MKHLEPLMTYLSPLPHGGRAHAGDVGARVGLGQAERGELEVLGEHPEVGLLELVGGGHAQRRGGQAVGAERGGDARTAPRELLLDDASIEVGRAGPAVLLGHVRVHEADLPRLAQDVLGPVAVLVVLPGDGADLLAGEVVRHLAQRLLLVGQREIDHCAFSSNSRLTGQSTASKHTPPAAGGNVRSPGSSAEDGPGDEGDRADSRIAVTSASAYWPENSTGRRGAMVRRLL